MTESNQGSSRLILICLLLIAANFVVFGSIRGHDFIALDDDSYVRENANVSAGLTKDSLHWAFTSFANSNWHPLTWLSHMLDCELFGLEAGKHLMVNLLLHSFSTVLLFLSLNAMTGRIWSSALVAALFAVHPLRVESVAWVAERKDVLSAFFWMLTLFLYSRFVRATHSWIRYGAVVVSFGLGLMAKPMLVTLPVVLLLLDYWPLHRFGLASIREKIPLFAMSAASSVMTFLAQNQGGAVQPIGVFPLSLRISNAITSYMGYIGKLIWPSKLAVFYPIDPNLSAGLVIFCFLFLVIMTIMTVSFRREMPYLFTGWFWYGITLLPVIGVVQVGEQSMADRYTYLPCIGLLIAIVWVIRESVQDKPVLMQFAAGSGLAIVIALGLVARSQVDLWQNSIRLFEHTLAVTNDNFLIENNLGLTFYRAGKPHEAYAHLVKAVELSPRHWSAHENLALVYASLGKPENAREHYEIARNLQPHVASLYYNIGVLEAGQGSIDQAFANFQKAINLNHAYPEAYNGAGYMALQLGRKEDAVQYFEQALLLKPESPEIHNNLGLAKASLGRFDEAAQEYSIALKLNPSFEVARRNLDRLKNLRR
jgi:tetratricopeptide (TPR) repeat protein